MNGPFLTGFDAQLLLTVAVSGLSWALYRQLARREFFFWWTLAWSSLAAFMLLFRLPEVVGAPELAGPVEVVAVPVALLQPTFFWLGAKRLRSREPIATRTVVVSVGATLAVGLAMGLAASGTWEAPEVARAYRGVVRQIALGAVLPYCGFVYLRARGRAGSTPTLLTVGGFLGYGLNQGIYALGSLGTLILVHFQVQIPSPTTYQVTGVAFGLDMLFEAAIGIGAALLLIEDHSRALRQLEASESRFRTTVADAPIGMALISDDGTFQRANRVLETMLGRSQDELEELGFLDVVVPRERDDLQGRLEELVGTPDRTIQGDYHLLGPHGEEILVHLHAGRSHDELAGGQVICQIQDLSVQEDLERIRRALITLVENSDDFIALGTPEEGISYVNPAGVRMVGAGSPGEVEGQVLLDLVTEADRSRVDRSLDRALDEEGRWSGELRFVRPDETEVPVNASVFRVDAGADAVHTVGTICRDISAQKKTEDELREAKEMAESANRAKSEFLATMSHEIRTPMNAIIGMAELLGETDLSPEQKDYVQVFSTAGETLLALINDVLDVSKMEAGHLALDERPFQLRDLVEQTVEMYGVAAHQKGLEIAGHVEPAVPNWVHGDPERLRQVLANLLGNALKFTEEGELVVDVSLRQPATDDRAPLLRFEVRDTGVGIPADRREGIFERFTQADSSTTREYGGTGLGLTICQGIVELMGGRIWVESELGEGSEFKFEIRLPEADPAEEPRELEGDRLQGLRALVVDDNATNRLILSELLTGWGLRPREASGGREAVKELERAQQEGRPYDLVLLDGHMPDMDGFEVAESIRTGSETPDVTIMMLTSGGYAQDLERVRKLGLESYMMKPVRRARLLESIRKAMGARTRPSGPADDATTQDGGGPTDDLKILLVEDQPENRTLVTAYLKDEPYEVTEAENGAEGVELVRTAEEPFDLILMDMRMPVMDGYEATRAIREWEDAEGRQRTTIVALTAHALPEEREKTMSAGCDHHLTKPIKKKKLLDALDTFARDIATDD